VLGCISTPKTRAAGTRGLLDAPPSPHNALRPHRRRMTPRPSFRISSFRNPSPTDTAMADMECGKGHLAGADQAQQAGPPRGDGGSSSSPPGSDSASLTAANPDFVRLSDWDGSTPLVRQQSGWTSVRSDGSNLVRSASLGACMVPSAPPASDQGSTPPLDAPAPSLGDDIDADVAARRGDADVAPRLGRRVSWGSEGRGAAPPRGKEARARAQEGLQAAAPAGMTAQELARARWRRWVQCGRGGGAL
jgi:hypothetical protein